MSTSRAALRISLRTIFRSPARSALITTMIGLPVLVITALATSLTTFDNAPSVRFPPLGHADATVWGDHSWKDVSQEPSGDGYGYTPGERPNQFTATQIATLFGPGSRVIALKEEETAYETAQARGRETLREVDLRDPIVEGAFRLLDGRLPRAPGEIAVTRKMMDKGARIGDTMFVTPQRRPVRIVGVVILPPSRSDTSMVALPGSLIDPPLAEPTVSESRAWLVDAPQPVTWKDVRRLNRAGLIVVSRAVLADPPAGQTDPTVTQPLLASGGFGLLPVVPALVLVMIVLEVVLLAGPAFAVGLRRRRTELALIAAQGGTAGQLRAIVLADGLVLGLGAAILGAAAGIAVAVVAMPWSENLMDSVAASLKVPWAAVAVIVILGTASGLIAALAPAAQASRTDVVAVLAGRSERSRDRVGWPLFGLALLVAGITAGVLTPRYGDAWVFVAAVLTQLGMIAVMPWLVRCVGRLAGRLPLPLRFAARDAARHRGRTAPAAAAVMTATALVTALAVAGTSLFARASLDYQPVVPPGTTVITGEGVPSQLWDRVRDVARRTLPAGVPLIDAAVPAHRDGSLMVMSMTYEESPDAHRISRIPPDLTGLGGMLVGDRRLLRILLGRDDPAAVAALQAGRAVVLNPDYVHGGKVTVSLTPQSSTGQSTSLTLPAVGVRATGQGWARVVVSANVLKRHGMTAEPRFLLVDPAAYRPSPTVQGRLEAGVGAITTHMSVRVERGFDQSYSGVLLLLAAAAAVMVLGATFVATRLAAADARPELTTLAEVGAGPGLRRAVVAGQAFVVAALGVVTGVIAGLVPGIAAAWPVSARQGVTSTTYGADGVPITLSQQDGPFIGLPWPLLALLLVGLPLLAALVAGLFGRTRIGLRRRFT
jgi:putative ABC transport system permease protein